MSMLRFDRSKATRILALMFLSSAFLFLLLSSAPTSKLFPSVLLARDVSRSPSGPSQNTHGIALWFSTSSSVSPHHDFGYYRVVRQDFPRVGVLLSSIVCFAHAVSDESRGAAPLSVIHTSPASTAWEISNSQNGTNGSAGGFASEPFVAPTPQEKRVVSIEYGLFAVGVTQLMAALGGEGNAASEFFSLIALLDSSCNEEEHRVYAGGGLAMSLLAPLRTVFTGTIQYEGLSENDNEPTQTNPTNGGVVSGGVGGGGATGTTLEVSPTSTMTSSPERQGRSERQLWYGHRQRVIESDAYGVLGNVVIVVCVIVLQCVAVRCRLACLPASTPSTAFGSSRLENGAQATDAHNKNVAPTTNTLSANGPERISVTTTTRKSHRMRAACSDCFFPALSLFVASVFYSGTCYFTARLLAHDDSRAMILGAKISSSGGGGGSSQFRIEPLVVGAVVLGLAYIVLCPVAVSVVLSMVRRSDFTYHTSHSETTTPLTTPKTTSSAIVRVMRKRESNEKPHLLRDRSISRSHAGGLQYEDTAANLDLHEKENHAYNKNKQQQRRLSFGTVRRSSVLATAAAPRRTSGFWTRFFCPTGSNHEFRFFGPVVTFATNPSISDSDDEEGDAEKKTEQIAQQRERLSINEDRLEATSPCDDDDECERSTCMSNKYWSLVPFVVSLLTSVLSVLPSHTQRFIDHAASLSSTLMMNAPPNYYKLEYSSSSPLPQPSYVSCQKANIALSCLLCAIMAFALYVRPLACGASNFTSSLSIGSLAALSVGYIVKKDLNAVDFDKLQIACAALISLLGLLRFIHVMVLAFVSVCAADDRRVERRRVNRSPAEDEKGKAASPTRVVFSRRRKSTSNVMSCPRHSRAISSVHRNSTCCCAAHTCACTTAVQIPMSPSPSSMYTGDAAVTSSTHCGGEWSPATPKDCKKRLSDAHASPPPRALACKCNECTCCGNALDLNNNNNNKNSKTSKSRSLFSHRTVRSESNAANSNNNDRLCHEGITGASPTTRRARSYEVCSNSNAREENDDEGDYLESDGAQRADCTSTDNEYNSDTDGSPATATSRQHQVTASCGGAASPKINCSNPVLCNRHFAGSASPLLNNNNNTVRRGTEDREHSQFIMPSTSYSPKRRRRDSSSAVLLVYNGVPPSSASLAASPMIDTAHTKANKLDRRYHSPQSQQNVTRRSLVQNQNMDAKRSLISSEERRGYSLAEVVVGGGGGVRLEGSVCSCGECTRCSQSPSTLRHRKGKSQPSITTFRHSPRQRSCIPAASLHRTQDVSRAGLSSESMPKVTEDNDKNEENGGSVSAELIEKRLVLEQKVAEGKAAARELELDYKAAHPKDETAHADRPVIDETQDDVFVADAEEDEGLREGKEPHTHLKSLTAKMSESTEVSTCTATDEKQSRPLSLSTPPAPNDDHLPLHSSGPSLASALPRPSFTTSGPSSSRATPAELRRIISHPPCRTLSVGGVSSISIGEDSARASLRCENPLRQQPCGDETKEENPSKTIELKKKSYSSISGAGSFVASLFSSSSSSASRTASSLAHSHRGPQPLAPTSGGTHTTMNPFVAPSRRVSGANDCGDNESLAVSLRELASTAQGCDVQQGVAAFAADNGFNRDNCCEQHSSVKKEEGPRRVSNCSPPISTTASFSNVSSASAAGPPLLLRGESGRYVCTVDGTTRTNTATSRANNDDVACASSSHQGEMITGSTAELYSPVFDEIGARRVLSIHGDDRTIGSVFGGENRQQIGIHQQVERKNNSVLLLQQDRANSCTSTGNKSRKKSLAQLFGNMLNGGDQPHLHD